MTVSVASCLYGHTYERFTTNWAAAVANLDPAPDAVIVAADDRYDIPGAQVFPSACKWRHPQAWYLQQAIEWAETDWVWIVDIDDLAMSDGLVGLDEVAADVWQLGFERSDGEVYLPPRMTAGEYLDSDRNVYVAASMIRVEAFQDCGGFPDVALQDWGLWRRMALNGSSFEPSTRTHFHYVRHPITRGNVELTMDARPAHLAEMMEAELAHA